MSNPQPITRDQVKLLLARGKAVLPDRFPKPDPTVVDMWHATLQNRVLPAEIWGDALCVWVTELAPQGTGICGPGNILMAVNVVLKRWEADPVMRRHLEKHREQQRQVREHRLAQGLHPNRELPAGQEREWVPSSSKQFRAKLLAELDLQRKTRKKGA